MKNERSMMRNNLIFAAALVLAAVIACLVFEPPSATPEPAEDAEAVETVVFPITETTPSIMETPPPIEETPAFDAPLSDLVATIPPEPRRPKADAVVRVKLPPQPPAGGYCSIEDKPLLLR